MIRLEIIPIDVWRNHIAPHWHMDRPEHIIAFNNPFGMIRYFGHELFTEMLFFPVALYVNDEPVAYSSIYNISSTHLRIRGIYVEKQHRGKGYGHLIISKMLELWPKPWNKVIGYFRLESWDCFRKYSMLDATPYINERLSLFTGKPLILAQRSFEPNTLSIQGSDFIKENISKYGFLGTNNHLAKFTEINQQDEDQFWGYDNSCLRCNKRVGSHNIFFIDLNKFVERARVEKKSKTMLTFKNLSFDNIQHKNIGIDDWVIKFSESEVLGGSVWSGDFLQAIHEAKKHTSNLRSSFLMDNNYKVYPSSQSFNLNEGGQYKHYIPLSRFEFNEYKNLEDIYGRVM